MPLSDHNQRFTASPTPAAVFYGKTANSKLALVDRVPNTTKRLRPVPRAPFVSSTYVSIAGTCPDSCVFKAAGCYVSSGFYSPVSKKLDAAAHALAPEDIIAQERASIVRFIDACHGTVPQDGGRRADRGRDLRLHVGGDVGNEAGARILALAAEDWIRARGGAVWTYTHLWRSIPRAAFGAISVLASVETPNGVYEAMDCGYAASLVVPSFKSRRVHSFGYGSESVDILPCPAETSKRSCVNCRMCFDDAGLLERRRPVGFKAHGPGAPLVKLHLREANKVQRVLDFGTT